MPFDIQKNEGLAMRTFSLDHDIALLHERLEVLTSQLAELEELRVLVLVAEQPVKRTRVYHLIKRIRTSGREGQRTSVGAGRRRNSAIATFSRQTH